MSLEKFIVYLLICFFLSFFIGIERQYRHRSVGLRTTILVAIGSYLFVNFSFLLNGYNIDVTRIAAQIVTGIGFLGAGVILKDGVKIYENPVGILKVRENKYDVSIASKYRGSRSTLKEAIKYRQQLEKLIYGEFRFNPNANSIISTSKNILVS